MTYDLKEDDFPSCFMYVCFFKLHSSIHCVPCTMLPQAILSLDDGMVVSDQTQLKYSAPLRFMIIINLEAEKLTQRTACHLYISQHITAGNISTNVCVVFYWESGRDAGWSETLCWDKSSCDWVGYDTIVQPKGRKMDWWEIIQFTRRSV